METTQTKQPGCNIFLIGFMGAGKSTIAAELKRQGVKNIAIPRESTADGIIEKILEEVKCEDSEG